MRKFNNLPIGSKPTYIIANLHRLECKECERILQEEIPFAAKQKPYTKSFVRYVMDLSKEMTINSIASHLKVSWDLIKEIQKINLQEKYNRLKAQNIRYLAIVEVSSQKGHKYLAVVMDLKSGAVIYVANGRKKRILMDFGKSRRPG